MAKSTKLDESADRVNANAIIAAFTPFLDTKVCCGVQTRRLGLASNTLSDFVVVTSLPTRRCAPPSQDENELKAIKQFDADAKFGDVKKYQEDVSNPQGPNHDASGRCIMIELVLGHSEIEPFFEKNWLTFRLLACGMYMSGLS